ncbi:MAG TPA: SBBP repeat-containing protein, partial [Haliangiales bacterium]|nr:SBBP repeat-containing protein [Haliangiales bacterium]
TAAPASGSGLAGWSGDFASCGFGQTCNVQVAAMRSGAARFEKGGYVVWAVKVQATGSAGIKNVRMTVGGDLIVAGTYAGEGDVNGAPLPSAPLGVGTPYVARLSGLDGSARWVRGFPTTGLLYANVSDFVVDPGTGDIVLAGSFGGTLDLGGPQPLVSDFNGDLFVARLSGADGSHVWSFVLTSTADEPAIHVALDQGRVLVFGSFTSSINLGDGVVRPTKGFQDMYLVWHSVANGALLSDPPPKTIGDPNASIIVADVVVDASHNIVATGSFSGTTKFGGGPLDPPHSPRGPGDAFVTKYDSRGTLVWVVTGGGPTSNFAYSAAVGPGNSVYATGYTSLAMATDAVIFNGVQAASSSGTSGEIFAVGITSDGSVTWVRRFGGPGDDYPQRVAVDGAGNVVIDGAFKQSFSFDAFTVAANGSEWDAFVSVLASSAGGSVVWADRYGGPNVDEAHGLAIDPVTQHWLVAGGFTSISKFGDKDLTAAGHGAGFCVRVIRSAR